MSDISALSLLSVSKLARAFPINWKCASISLIVLLAALITFLLAIEELNVFSTNLSTIAVLLVKTVAIYAVTISLIKLLDTSKS